MKTPSAEPALRGSHLKSWRAWELSCHLQASIERWLHAGGYKLERQWDDDNGEHRVSVRFNTLPGEWSLLIGECIQNLRNSLDNLVYGLALLNVERPLTEKEAQDLAFPITSAKLLGADRAERTIGLLQAPVRDFILRAQPSAGSRSYQETKLWVLQQMSNFDKHRLIPTALVSLEGVMTTAMVSDFSSVPPLKPVSDGDWIASFTTSGALDTDNIGLHCTFDVVFDETFGPAVHGVSVVQVLKDLREYVQKMHNQLLSLAGYAVDKPWA